MALVAMSLHHRVGPPAGGLEVGGEETGPRPVLGHAPRARVIASKYSTGRAREGTISTTVRAYVIAVLACLLVATVPPVSDAATESELQSAVFRAKPAVVMIMVRIGATATVRCSDASTAVVQPGSIGELGSGSIIHPEGWIVTNGHVVQPYQEGADGAFAAELLYNP
jgi:S1-C subfamily serine protease